MDFNTWLRLNRSRRTESALMLGFIVLIAVIGVSGWRSAAKLTEFIEAADNDRYYAHLVNDLQGVMTDLTTAQNEQRGYMITGDPTFLASYEAAVVRTRNRFDDLVRLTSSDNRFHPHVAALDQLSGKRVQLMNDTIGLQRAGDERRANELVRRGRALNAAIQQRLDEARDEYESAFTQTRGQVVALRTDTIRSFVVTAILAGVVLAIIGVIIMVEARFVRQLSNQLLRESRYDNLTGLPNRAYLNDSLARAILGAKRVGEKLGLLYMDLNGFKKINDTFGHQTGDEVLIEAARWFEGAARGADFVARLGGDEFAVVLPRVTDRTQLATTAERFGRIAITRGAHTVSTSVGFALFPDDGRTAEELTQLSDAAMYERKQKSKRR